MNLFFKFLRKGIYVLFVLLVILLLINIRVEKRAQKQLYNSTDAMPHNKVGLLLGTGKYLSNGHLNLYYKYRLDAAEMLYRAGKIDFILVSGDNHRKGYDEPTMMFEDLVKRGVPKEKIYLDYAGFRTLDSVVRSKMIFGQSKITIISQQFHNERALFIARKRGLDALAFNAKDVSRRYGFKVRVREYLARVKMILDLNFGKKPKFLGEPIEIK